jgi:hypothetical protein
MKELKTEKEDILGQKSTCFFSFLKVFRRSDFKQGKVSNVHSDGAAGYAGNCLRSLAELRQPKLLS